MRARPSRPGRRSSPVPLLVVLVLLILPLAATPEAGAAEPLEDPAFDLLHQRVHANEGAFHVYRNADSGFNHGFPSGLFADDPETLAKISLDFACIDDPAAVLGCSSDPRRLDRERGTVFRITFAPLAAGEFAGVNVEEPENWGADPRGVGYDLRGAERLVLDVRSPDGARVQFGVGGSTTGFRTLPQQWTTLSLPLDSLVPGPGEAPLDLSDVHRLLTVVTNHDQAPAGGTVLLDDVRFEPVPAFHRARRSFPLGTQTFGVVPRRTPAPGRVPFPSDQVLRNLTTTYESALVMLALADRGTAEDRADLRRLAEAFHVALHNDNRGLPLPAAPDGSTGLHSGYGSGDLTLLNDQGPGAGQAGQIRLSGFTAAESVCGPSRFCVLLDGATGGNVAFAIEALLAAYETLGDSTYLEDARILARWIEGNLRDRTGTGFGGYFLGYPDGGVHPKPLLLGKSVENNADVFAAFTSLAEVERRLGDGPAAQRWRQRAEVAGDFVMEMFDPVSGCFFAGTVPGPERTGEPLPEPSPGLDPSGPARGGEVVNVFPFLDANTFTTLALAADDLYRNRIDWRRPTRCTLDRFATAVEAGGNLFRGFNLVEAPSAGPDGVAWEFTGQVVVLLRFVDALYGESLFREEADLYLEELRRARLHAPFGDGLGVVASTMEGGATLPPLEHCLTTPFQCIPQRVGLAATAWALYAERNLNPLLPLGVEAPGSGEAPELLLGDERFAITAHWRTAEGSSGFGTPVAVTGDTGYFWFFDDANVEVVVKVLDACPAFDRFWVFAAGLTNVGVTLEVEDRRRRSGKAYQNDLGTPFQPILDTNALATCP